MYFYVLYLVERTPYASLVGALAFLPQAVLVVAAGGLLYRDPPLSWFVQTVLFVTFNKVCTSQVSLSDLLAPFLLAFLVLHPDLLLHRAPSLLSCSGFVHWVFRSKSVTTFHLDTRVHVTIFLEL